MNRFERRTPEAARLADGVDLENATAGKPDCQGRQKLGPFKKHPDESGCFPLNAATFGKLA
nr:hypothetical protein [uncultured Pseudomonas sp.]